MLAAAHVPQFKTNDFSSGNIFATQVLQYEVLRPRLYISEGKFRNLMADIQFYLPDSLKTYILTRTKSSPTFTPLGYF